MKFISPEDKLKTIGFKFSKESQQSTFQFVKKDFECNAGSTTRDRCIISEFNDFKKLKKEN